MRALGRRRRRANEPGICASLSHILRGGNRERRNLHLANIIIDRQCLERRERSNQAMDLVLFHHFLSLATRRRRDTPGIPRHQLDLPTRHRVVALLQEHIERTLHIDAAGSERSGLYSQKTDTDRAIVGPRSTGSRDARQANTRDARYESTT